MNVLFVVRIFQWMYARSEEVVTLAISMLNSLQKTNTDQLQFNSIMNESDSLRRIINMISLFKFQNKNIYTKYSIDLNFGSGMLVYLPIQCHMVYRN